MGALIASIRSILHSYASKSISSGLILLAFGIAMLAPEAAFCTSEEYTSQGAFRVKSNAENLLRELETSGRVAFMLEKTVKGKPLYVVMAHNTKEAAPAPKASPKPAPAIKPEPESPIASDYHSSSAHMLRKEPVKTDSTGRLVLKPLSKRRDMTLALSPMAKVYTSPDDNSEAIGMAVGLGALWYVKSSDGWHSVWLSDSRYGYVKESDAALVRNEESGTPGISAASETQDHAHSN